MLRLLTFLLLFLPALALAQGGPVQQTGPVTPGHIAVWATNGVVQGGGPATNGKITNLGIVGGGVPFCINDAPAGSVGGWHQFCLGANAAGGGLLSYNALGGATPLPLQCNVNGVTSNCGAAGGGGNPGGSPTNVQFNNVSAFGGDSTFTFNNTTKVVGGQAFNSANGFQQNGQNVVVTTNANTVLPACTQCNTLIGTGNPGGMESSNDFETTAIGFGALSHQSNAGLSGVSESTAVGWAAGYNITTGSQIAIFGVHALGTCHQCGDIVLMGTDTMRNSDNTDGGNEASNMVCIGINACLNSEEFEDVVIGIGANEGSLSGTGSNNIAIGQGTMGGGANTTDIGNIAMGTFTLHAVTSASRNVTIGFESMLVATTASDNTCIGDQTCTSMTTDGQNVVIGERSGNFLSGSSFNVFVGNATGQNDVSSNFNTYIGWNAGSGTPVTGANNTALGAKAMLNSPESNAVAVGLGALAGSASDTGTGNTALGYEAIGSGNNTSAAGETAVGYFSLNALTTGLDNTCVGWECMWLATTAGANTVMGTFAGNSMTTDFQNTVIGFRAGQTSATSQNNVFVGSQAGFNNTTGRGNTFVGSGAGWCASGCGNAGGETTGQNNTVIGQLVGSVNLGTGQGNILVGVSSSVDVPLANASHALNIGNVITGTESDAAGAAHPNVCTIGQPCIIGLLRGANWGITTDQTIPILPMTPGGLGYLPSATKYRVTAVWVENCTGALSSAAGGVYDAASKGGNALVAAGQTWATCTSATTMQTATLGAALSVKETAQNLFLSLTTGNGTTQTGDIFIEGIMSN